MGKFSSTKSGKIEQVNRDMSECTLCDGVDLTTVYAGKYRKNQKLFFVGAAPFTAAGPDEALSTGRASDNFNMFLEKAGIDRKLCYVTNAVTHIPVYLDGRSRNPNPQEIKNCSRYLKFQIDALQPKIVVALGSVALTALSAIETHLVFSISRSIGKPHDWYGRKLFALTHPSPNAVAIRPAERQIEDYMLLRDYYERTVTAENK